MPTYDIKQIIAPLEITTCVFCIPYASAYKLISFPYSFEKWIPTYSSGKWRCCYDQIFAKAVLHIVLFKQVSY